MRSNRNYHTRTYKPVKKPRRRLLFGSLVSIIPVVFLGYGMMTLGKDVAQPPPAVTVPSPEVSKPKKIQPLWPATGQAAIGSLEDGLLARSSPNEIARPIASMAKVITALAIMEKQPLELGQSGLPYTLTVEDVVNYHQYVAKNGSVVPVYEGMVLTQYQAMQAMLIVSGNNMADTLVKRIFGSMEAYTSYAQDMVQRMGLHQIVVADASGYSPATIGTPSEVVALGIAALKNPVIAEIVAQPEAWLPDIGHIKNTNKLLGTEGVIGIKTGTTDEAGSCLLFAARHTNKDGQNITIVGVVMGNPNLRSLYTDSRQLLTSVKHELGSVKTSSKEQDNAQ
ncbi:MAG TPA: D-alanyl-D-alanine carboxypeptidase [Verrucomicrobiae bacterium]|nr:D-alanyl-D-alanine carboxypeptidase [Verrucomicrobiae bacterium]